MRDLRNNPFLTLGVSADAEMSEIRQIAKRLLMEVRLSGNEDPMAVRRIEDALEVLQDPVHRFQWGLFWPELGNAEVERFRSDPVLSSLEVDPTQDGADAYMKIADSESIVVRSHNLGALMLLQAVAATEEAQKGTPDDIADDLECLPIWEKAFRYFKVAIGSDEFWMRQKLRAKLLGDARLDSRRVEEIREGLKSELLGPVGEVIRTALLDGHATVATIYVKLVRNSGFGDDLIEEILSKVYKPLADRVERNIKHLEETLESIGEDECDEEVFTGLLREFSESTSNDLNVMIKVGDLPGYAEEHARDIAAEFLRNLSVKAWNCTGKSGVARKAIQASIRIADAESIKSRVKKDLDALKEIEAQRASAEKLRPLHNRLEVALDAERFEEALSIIEKLIQASPEEDRKSLKVLRKRLSSRVATDLFNQAVQCANAQKFTMAQRLLDKALSFETDPNEKAIILRARAQIPSSDATTGCVVTLMAFAMAAALAIVSGATLYEFIQ